MRTFVLTLAVGASLVFVAGRPCGAGERNTKVPGYREKTLTHCLARLNEPSYLDRTLTQWLADLKSRDKAARRDAAEYLRQLDPRTLAPLPALRAALKDPDSAVRSRAAASLVWLDRGLGPEAQPVLIQALCDAEAGVRADAAEALGLLGSEARPAVPALRRALKDEKNVVREAAAVALASIDPAQAGQAVPVLLAAWKSPAPHMGLTPVELALKRMARPNAQVVPALITALHTADRQGKGLFGADLQAHAAFEFGLIGPQAASAAKDLRRVCRGTQPDLKALAALALIQIDPANVKEAVPVLTAVLADADGETCGDVAAAFADIGPAASAAVPALLRAYRKHSGEGDGGVFIARALGEIGPAAPEILPALKHLLHGNELDQLSAVHALRLIGPPAREAVPDLKRVLTNGDELVRVWAAQALARIDPAQAVACVPVLAAALSREEEVVEITEALQGIGPAARGAVPALKTALAAWPPPARPFALHALVAIDPGEALKSVPSFRAGLKDSNLEERRYSARALGLVGPAARDAVPDLLAALEDPDLCCEAAEALGRIGPASREVVPALQLAFKTTIDARRPVPAARSAADATTPAVPTMLETLKDPGVITALDALRIAEQITPVSAAIWSEMLEPLKDPGARRSRAAARALGRIGRGARNAVPELVTARSDRDAEVRLAAAVALVRIDPSRAEDVVPQLRAALRDPDWGVRSGAASALGQLGPAGAGSVADLAILQRDPVKFVRRAAADALLEIKPARSP